MREMKQGNFSSHTTEIDSEKYIYQVYEPTQVRNVENPPLIVFLHGIRERGTGGFVGQGPLGFVIQQYLNQIPAVVLIPQCRPNKYWSDPTMDKMVIQAVDQTVKEFDADPKRIY